MTRRVPLTVAIVSLSALAAGCGGGAPSTSGTSSTGTVGATTTTSAAAPPPPPASLNGSTVSLSANYPTADEVFTNTSTGTVPVSWPKGTLYSTRNKLVQVNASLDVTGTQVTETFLMSARLGTGTFNGPVYKFTGAPAITKVTVDPQSDPAVAPTGIAFTADSISVNDSGLTVTNGAKQILDVTFATP
ncbi:MAG: hypothetical protein ACLQLO_07145 [Mycobacterium sp.]